jgi:high-affinity Fe2+/Pb2+ permease
MIGVTVFAVAAAAGLIAIGLWYVDRRRHRGSRRW